MSKKIKKVALFFLLFMFIFTQFSVSYAASSSFTPYKAVITASSLNIRQTPSTSGKIVGYYKKGTIVDVVGISGSFLKTNKGYIASAYTKKYTTTSTTTASRGTSFTPYKVIITSSYLNIRQGPSTSYKIVGKYYKNNIVDIIGVYGSFLKTNKGYIASAYTKKYVVAAPATPAPTSTPPLYRAKVLASILSIRQEASSSSKEVGKYYRGDVVDVFAKEGSFLKTSKGYIYESYTERIQDTSRGNTSNNVGKYLLVNEDTQLLLNTDGTHDERYAVKGKTYKIIDEQNGYFKIKMGAIYGYIAADKVTVLDYQVKDKLTVAWNYIYAKSSNSIYWKDNSHYINNNSASYGLDVISPTWLYMTGDYKNPSSIKVAEKADREYVIRAHRNGYEVHGLFSEFSADRAYAMFTNSSIRQKVIDDVVNYALTYNLDGINIDFEALGVKNKAYFTAFVKDLSERLHKANLTVSVDVTKITTDSNIYSGGYDRAALSKYVDYVMLMAYDEHYSGSKTPGSVGSYPWVDSSVKGLINSGVPSDKLILGVPFYAREFTLSIDQAVQVVIFNTDQSGIYSQPVLSDDLKIENATLDGSYGYISLANGWYTVEYNGGQAYIPESDATLIKIGNDSQTVIDSRALKMQAVADNKVKYNGRVYFDDKAKQNVLEYIDSDGNKRLTWIEDASSMAWRMDIVNQYNLKGMAAWQTGFETRDIWDVIKQKLK
ncbi:SH3 domain-containing protein [Caloramator quimbayensis]|uniref:SH3 domain-containing protein n=1 Tax=Caloramator quimbayensis TaxID=1147123 RepID=A0A1T4XP21_9CLOT|nr:glycosyl hydrolase family 18 protein [Caloramator quimbayensis]SKA91292.1 SH3 domain-containing protein [Caloramator quimbayensis]